MTRRGMAAAAKVEVVEPEALAVFEPGCKLCKLSKTAPEVMEFIYQCRFQDNLGFKEIHDQVNALCQQRGLPLKIYVSNLVTHLNNHVSINRSLVRDLTVRALPKERKMVPDAALARVLATKRNNYEQLQENFEKWQKVFDVLFKKFEKLEKLDNDSGGDPATAVLKPETVRTMKDASLGIGIVVGAMDKFIRDKDFVLEVMSYAVDLYATQAAHRLGQGLAKIKEQLIDHDPTDPKTVAWYDNEIRHMLFGVVDGLYEECKDAAARTFNL